MTATVIGPMLMTASLSQDGFPSAQIVWKVETDDPMDGPLTVRSAAGLAAVGSSWAFGNDSETWLLCTPQMDIAPFDQKNDEPVVWWRVTQYFAHPMSQDVVRCQTAAVDDPLMEPDRISGSFVNYTEEVFRDRYGNPILTSSHEMIRGSIVEFDKGKDRVVIETNRSSLDLATITALKHHVNDSPMWGLPARCVKFSNFSWSREYYGICTAFYRITMEFDIDFETFDRQAIDEGQMVLSGAWECGEYVVKPLAMYFENVITYENQYGNLVTECATGTAIAPQPNRFNPLHFIRFKDRNGENATVVLNGEGVPATGTDSIGTINIEYYQEADLLTTLQLPTSF